LQRLLHFVVAVMMISALIGKADLSALAAIPRDDDPKRTIKINVPYIRHWWWLVRWADNWVTCTFHVEHPGIPNGDEVKSFCGPVNFNLWSITVPCDLGKVKSLNECPGLYLHFLGTSDGEREITIELPVPEAWVSLEGCEPVAPTYRCTTKPNLVITGKEPLPNEDIIRIQGTVGGVPFSCPGAECRVPLYPTGMQGTQVEFWADSSFGDASKHYTAQVRLVPWGDFMNPEAKPTDTVLYYVDVLSSQWRGGKLASCSETWQVFPDVGGPPAWLKSPESTAQLQSEIPYYLLAAVLIQNGEVDASNCPGGGIQSPRVANPCGVEAARSKLVEWQNLFNDEILRVAQDTGVPAQVMKNIFSRESQFWPGIYRSMKEAGLGQMTENGADTVLLWNPDFFKQFCPLVLSQESCGKGFAALELSEQNMLRGALVRQVNAACPECDSGVDLRQANFSVRIFAESLLANCEQVAQVLYNATLKSPGQVSRYDDLWRYTLVNYNAGPGCLSKAVQAVTRLGAPLTWENVKRQLDPACQGAIDYVEDISSVSLATPTPTPWINLGTPLPTPVVPQPGTVIAFPTNTPFRTATPTRTPTLILPPTETPTPTPTRLNQ
jgi:hypothetical protein